MSKTIADIRRDYASKTLRESDIDKDPFLQFKTWFEEAASSNLADPTAMSLATVNNSGRPSNRIVLLKGFSHDGFTFYTNYESRKAKDLEINNFASINFFWPELERQIRIEGIVSKVSRSESEAYFNSRPRGSQIGAWVSKQSEHVSLSQLEQLLKEEELKWENKPVECPSYWGGYLLKPDYFEFWQGRPSRLHDRIEYIFKNNAWVIGRLSP